MIDLGSSILIYSGAGSPLGSRHHLLLLSTPSSLVLSFSSADLVSSDFKIMEYSWVQSRVLFWCILFSCTISPSPSLHKPMYLVIMVKLLSLGWPYCAPDSHIHYLFHTAWSAPYGHPKWNMGSFHTLILQICLSRPSHLWKCHQNTYSNSSQTTRSHSVSLFPLPPCNGKSCWLTLLPRSNSIISHITSYLDGSLW